MHGNIVHSFPLGPVTVFTLQSWFILYTTTGEQLLVNMRVSSSAKSLMTPEGQEVLWSGYTGRASAYWSTLYWLANFNSSEINDDP
jgi:hypothetical protein